MSQGMFFSPIEFAEVWRKTVYNVFISNIMTMWWVEPATHWRQRPRQTAEFNLSPICCSLAMNPECNIFTLLFDPATLWEVQGELGWNEYIRTRSPWTQRHYQLSASFQRQAMCLITNKASQEVCTSNSRRFSVILRPNGQSQKCVSL